MDLLSLIRRVGQAADDVSGIRAYHSGPRKFRTFDPDMIGSTTGARTGYGHYKQLAEEAVDNGGEVWDVYDYARKALAPSLGDAGSKREAVQRLRGLGVNGFFEDSQDMNVYVMFPGTEDRISYLRSISLLPAAAADTGTLESPQ